MIFSPILREFWGETKSRYVFRAFIGVRNKSSVQRYKSPSGQTNLVKEDLEKDQSIISRRK